MPVANQPVYSPASGAPIQSVWGQGVANAVIQVFGSVITGTGREYMRVSGAWQTVPIIIGGGATISPDAAGNGAFTYARAFPGGAIPQSLVAICQSYANVGCVPFNIGPTQASIGLRRPADNSIVTVAVGIYYVATLM
jgi:hypothetical protein